MSRFIQETYTKPTKESKDLPKYGGKSGQKDYSKLAEAKKIPTKDGYK